jgi:hypothetical protein
VKRTLCKNPVLCLLSGPALSRARGGIRQTPLGDWLLQKGRCGSVLTRLQKQKRIFLDKQVKQEGKAVMQSLNVSK